VVVCKRTSADPELPDGKNTSMLTHFLATGKFQHVASDLKRNDKRFVDFLKKYSWIRAS
jgi:hypothetical protein